MNFPTLNRSWPMLATLAALGLVAILVLLRTTSPAPPACPQPLPLTRLTFDDAELLVEIAASESARQCGLARRDALPPGSGMLFVYNDDAVRTFWMKDTRMPLAIAFIDRNRTVIQLEQMQPLPADKLYQSLDPVRYVLETTPGWFALNGIAPGARASFVIPSGITVENTARPSLAVQWWQMLFQTRPRPTD